MTESEFKSLEDVVKTTVEKVLERLEKDFVLVPKKEWKEFKNYDKKILNTLKNFDEPISLDYLSHETGIDKARLCKKLKILEKFGKVRCVTKKVTSYWKVIND